MPAMPGGMPFPPLGGLPPNFQFPPPQFPPQGMPGGAMLGPGGGRGGMSMQSGPGGFGGPPPGGFSGGQDVRR